MQDGSEVWSSQLVMWTFGRMVEVSSHPVRIAVSSVVSFKSFVALKLIIFIQKSL